MAIHQSYTQHDNLRPDLQVGKLENYDPTDAANLEMQRLVDQELLKSLTIEIAAGTDLDDNCAESDELATAHSLLSEIKTSLEVLEPLMDEALDLVWAERKDVGLMSRAIEAQRRLNEAVWTVNDLSHSLVPKTAESLFNYTYRVQDNWPVLTTWPTTSTPSMGAKVSYGNTTS